MTPLDPVSAPELWDVDRWCICEPLRQHTLLAAIAAASRRELQLVTCDDDLARGRMGGPRLLHRRSGLRFCLVPGGEATFGVPDEARSDGRSSGGLVLDRLLATLHGPDRELVELLTRPARAGRRGAFGPVVQDADETDDGLADRTSLAPFLLAETPLEAPHLGSPPTPSQAAASPASTGTSRWLPPEPEALYFGPGDLEDAVAEAGGSTSTPGTHAPRLPSEREWEHAYRATNDDSRLFPWGNNLALSPNALGLGWMGAWDEAVADLGWVRGGWLRLARSEVTATAAGTDAPPPWALALVAARRPLSPDAPRALRLALSLAL